MNTKNKKTSFAIILFVLILVSVFAISSQAKAFALRSRVPLWCFLGIIHCWSGPAEPTLAFSANPTLVQWGQSSTLSWASANTTSCTASAAPANSQWAGVKTTSGSQVINNLMATTDFSMTCTGPNGSVTKDVTVTVTGSPPIPVVTFPSPPYTPPDWCASAFQYTINWNLNTEQLAKQIQVSTSPGFNSITYDSGKVTSSITSYSLPASGSGLEYDKTYYCRVKAWNIEDVTSAWSATQTITTPHNAYPTPNFSWSPFDPKTNETVQFVDLSVPGAGAAINQWSWAFQDGLPATSTSQNDLVSFHPKGTKVVFLTVTDNNNYSCSIQKSINIGSSPNKPFWQEIIPW